MMSGLFSWVWDLLYAISKSMYAIIDNLLKCANMLCGIVPIQYKGADTDSNGTQVASFIDFNEGVHSALGAHDFVNLVSSYGIKTAAE